MTLNWTTLKLNSISIQGLHSNFDFCESFFESNSPNFLNLFEWAWKTYLTLAISLWGVTYFQLEKKNSVA